MSLGLQKYSVKPGIPLRAIPVNPKISVNAFSTKESRFKWESFVEREAKRINDH